MNVKKKRIMQISMVLIVLIIGFGLWRVFSEYAKIQEEIKLRTAYYVKTGQVLDIVQKEFLEGSAIESNNTNVAEVTEDGLIKANNPGTAKITVTTNPEVLEDTAEAPLVNSTVGMYNPDAPEDNYQVIEEDVLSPEEKVIQTVFDVVVKEPVQGVELNVLNANLIVGDTIQLSPMFIPDDAYNKNVSYVSSDNNIVTVNSNGLVTATNPGNASVDVITEDGGFRSTSHILVISKDSNTLYVKETGIEIFTGEEAEVNADVSPDDSKNSEITYSSSDNNIFTVDKNGKIIGRVHGQATLSVSYGNQTKLIPVTIKEKVVESLQTSPKRLSLKVGETAEIATVITPDDALNKVLTYISSDKSVATVESGKVRAVSSGTAIITVRADSGVTSAVSVEVESKENNNFIEVKNLTVTPTSKTLEIGQTFVIQGVVTPANASNANLTFVSNNPKIATVGEDGTVTAIAAGKTTIDVVSSNNIKKSVSIEVKAPTIKVTGITVNPTTITGKIGEVVNLQTTLTPTNATNKVVTYKSANTKIASVSAAGVVNLKSAGTTAVTITSADGAKVSVPVTVINNPSLIVNKTNLNLTEGLKEQLSTSVTPASYYGKEQVVYQSSNGSVATVTATGQVTAIKEGSATITVSLKNYPQIKATVTVKVTKIAVTSIRVLRTDNSDVYLGKHLYLEKGVDLELVSWANPGTTTYLPTWSIADTSIATITTKKLANNRITGVIKGKKIGQTTLTVKAGDKTKTIKIKVEYTGDKVYFSSRDDGGAGGYGSDAIIFKSKGKFGMIDAGKLSQCNESIGKKTSSDELASLMAGLGIKELDFFALTHWHGDHYGCVSFILSRYKIKNFYTKDYYGYEKWTLGNAEATAKKEIRVSWEKSLKATGSSIKKPTSFSLGNFKFTPYNTGNVFDGKSSYCKKHYCNENMQSVIYYAKVNGKKLYFSGDIENNSGIGKPKYTTTLAKKVGKVDFYKAAHHGYAWNNTAETLDVLKPSSSIVTNKSTVFKTNSTDATKGIGNRAGVNRMEAYGTVYFTHGKYTTMRIPSSGKLVFTTIGN